MLYYYIASNIHNITNVRNAILELNLLGYKNTYDWSKHGRMSTGLKEIAENEMQGVLNADFLVMIMPAYFGSHVELGLALSKGIPCYIITNNLDYEDKSFYHLDNVRLFESFNTLSQFLQHGRENA
jgi:nucleoside 2-deoxyribosyltransferase